MIGKRLSRYRDVGLLILRIGIGIAFMAHGIPKLAAGPHTWTFIGQAMGNLGIHFAPAFWGFMSAAAEGIGGLLLVLGLAFRPACAVMLFNMIVALTLHLHRGDSFDTYSHALEDGIVFLSLLIIGPGKYSLDRD